jgi:hypothetical protein
MHSDDYFRGTFLEDADLGPANPPLLIKINQAAGGVLPTKNGNPETFRCPKCSKGTLRPHLISTDEFIMMCKREIPSDKDVSNIISLASQTNRMTLRLPERSPPA